MTTTDSFAQLGQSIDNLGAAVDHYRRRADKAEVERDRWRLAAVLALVFLLAGYAVPMALALIIG